MFITVTGLHEWKDAPFKKANASPYFGALAFYVGIRFNSHRNFIWVVLKMMGRAELLGMIKQRHWSFRPAVSGKEFYGLVSGDYRGMPFYFYDPVPYLSQEDHSEFWNNLQLFLDNYAATSCL